MPTGFRNMRRPMGLSGWSCGGLGSLPAALTAAPSEVPPMETSASRQAGGLQGCWRVDSDEQGED